MDEPNIAEPPVISTPPSLPSGAVNPIQTSAPAPKGPWGFWATLGWGLLVTIAYVVVQGISAAVYAMLGAVVGSNRLPAARDLATDGLAMSIAIILSAPVAIGLPLILASVRRGITLGDYLGLRWPRGRIAVGWALALLALAILSDTLTVRLDRPIVPDVMVEIYRRAGFVPLFWLAIVLVAPLSEEILFRGFLFTGVRQSRLGGTGAIIITSVAWASLHIQYDIYGVITIFTSGLFLGFVRLKTGSLPLCILLHALMNLLATVETVILLPFTKA